MSLRYFVIQKIGKIIPDKLWIQIKYFQWFKRLPNLKNPQTFNEKLNWLKLYDRRDEYTLMVDKYEAKKYISEKVGEEYIIPTIGGPWNDFDEINFDLLPEQFVLKTTHDCGGVFICKDKDSFDYEYVKKEISKHLISNYFMTTREWPYKNVKPRIIAEMYMVDESGYELKDYKLMCFNGKVKCSFVCSNRGSATGLFVNFYDRDWNPMPFERHYPKNPVEIGKPDCYERMIEIAEKLSADTIFVRVDFYQISGKPYLGELTFYPGAGLEEFSPESWDYTLGEWIQLSS